MLLPMASRLAAGVPSMLTTRVSPSHAQGVLIGIRRSDAASLQGAWVLAIESVDEDLHAMDRLTLLCTAATVLPIKVAPSTEAPNGGCDHAPDVQFLAFVGDAFGDGSLFT
jgi:hypothetical protein